MITYVYETIPQQPRAKTRYYQIAQNAGAPSLTAHPQTGEPIRRVNLGELGELTLPEAKCSPEEPSASPRECGCIRLPGLT